MPCKLPCSNILHDVLDVFLALGVQSRVLAAHSIGGPYIYKGVPIFAVIMGTGVLKFTGSPYLRDTGPTRPVAPPLT